jgi:hypothetical protein
LLNGHHPAAVGGHPSAVARREAMIEELRQKYDDLAARATELRRFL